MVSLLARNVLRVLSKYAKVRYFDSIAASALLHTIIPSMGLARRQPLGFRWQGGTARGPRVLTNHLNSRTGLRGLVARRFKPRSNGRAARVRKMLGIHEVVARRPSQSNHPKNSI